MNNDLNKNGINNDVKNKVDESQNLKKVNDNKVSYNTSTGKKVIIDYSKLKNDLENNLKDELVSGKIDLGKISNSVESVNIPNSLVDNETPAQEATNEAVPTEPVNEVNNENVPEVQNEQGESTPGPENQAAEKESLPAQDANQGQNENLPEQDASHGESENLPEQNQEQSENGLPTDQGQQSGENLPQEGNNSNHGEKLPQEGEKNDENTPENQNDQEKPLTDEEKRDQAESEYFRKKQEENKNLPENGNNDSDLANDIDSKRQALNDKASDGRNNPRETDDLKKEENNENPDQNNKKGGSGNAENKTSNSNNTNQNGNNGNNKDNNKNKNNNSNNNKNQNSNQNNNNANKNKNSRIPDSMRRKGTDPRESFKPKDMLSKAGNNLKNKLLGGNKKTDTAKDGGGVKETTKETISIIKFIIKNPWVLIVLLCVVSVFFILLLLLGMFGTGATAAGGYIIEQEETTYESPNFTSASFVIVNTDGSPILSGVSIDDYVIGMAMLDVDVNSMTNDQMKAYMVLAKTKLLTSVNYNDSTSVYYITVGTPGLEYCNPDYGCTEYSDGTNTYYYPTNILSSITTSGTATGNTVAALDSTKLETLKTVYYESSYDVLLPEGSTDITSFSSSSYSTDLLSSSVLSKITSASGAYDSILSSISELSGYSTVDAQAYIETYSSIGCGNVDWWWPSGSDVCTEENGVTMCTGTPSQTGISAGFPKYSKGGVHKGIDITNQDGTAAGTNVIAAADGTVLAVYNSCEAGVKSCNYKQGNFVKIDHGNGYVTKYMHMAKGSVTVKVGDKVVQGQKIGEVGLTGNTTGYHLHFQVELNGTPIQPLTKVSAETPRQGECKQSTGGMSLNKTSLTQSEFKSKMEAYCTKTKNTNFCNNFSKYSDTIYTTSVANNVNPELVVVTAGTEQGWNSHGTNNYWGINVPNTTSTISTTYSSLAEGIKAYATLINKYSQSGTTYYNMIQNVNSEREKAGCKASGHGSPGTLAGMQSIYSGIGVCRLNPGGSGSGGCYYLNIIYGSNYCSTKATCTSFNNYSEESKTTVCEQNDYTAYQIQGKIDMRNAIFG